MSKMRIKDFSLFEEEILNREKTPAEGSKPAENRIEPRRGEKEENPKTKDMFLGNMKDGKEVMAKMKVGHTIELDGEELKKCRNMKVSEKERDMLPHYRGGRDYRIAKEKDGTFTIFHYNKTIHELTPVGVFELPPRRAKYVEHKNESLTESILEFAVFKKIDKGEEIALLKKMRTQFSDAEIGGREMEGKSFIVATSTMPLVEVLKTLEKMGIEKEEVYTF